MNRQFMSCAVGLLSLAPMLALASDKTEVVALVHKWGSDVVSTCADETSILDSIPPYEWHGTGACARWHTDLEAFASQNGITDWRAVVGKASHIEIAADHAYLVAPATFRYKDHGKDAQERATATFALQKVANGWRITAWTYSLR